MSTLLFVSGASRGLGRAIALACAETPALQHAKLRAVLLARSSDGLLETERQMRRIRPTNLDVRRETVDLSDLDTLEECIEPILEQEAATSAGTKLEAYDRAILLNCAGSTGYIGPRPSLSDIRDATNLNFISKTYVSTSFVRHFGGLREDDHVSATSQSTVKPECTIVNVSSMCAVKPTPTMALYCATSAGRDMYHTVLAGDHLSNVRILNYAPGSCDTDMQAMLRNHERLDPAVQAYCRSLVDFDSLVDCRDTSANLTKLLFERDSFTSGERIEYVSASTYKY